MADYNLVKGALDRGYSLDEIANKISASNSIDPAQVRERGYSSQDILGKFGYEAPKEETPPSEGLAKYLGKKLVRGVIDTASGIGRSGEIAAGGLANLVGADELRDKLFSAADNLKDSTENVNQYIAPVDDASRSRTERIAGNIVGMAPTIGAMMVNPALGAGMLESGSMNSTIDDVRNGVDTATAEKMLAARTAGNAAMLAIPSAFGATALRKVASGAAIAPVEVAAT